MIETAQELRLGSNSIKQEVLKTQKLYLDEINRLGSLINLIVFPNFISRDIMFICILSGVKLKGLVDAAQNYHTVLAENRKLYNEVQDLKGAVFFLLYVTTSCSYVKSLANISWS